MSQFYNVKTNAGDAAIANAIATNTKLNITHVAFGDGNGAVPTPDKLRTTLVSEVHRQAVNKYTQHPTVANWITVEAIIPSATGGFWIREIGIIADGIMITHGSHAPFYKVADTEGVSEYRLKFTIDIQDASIVQLTLDESLIYATQAWVNENYIPRTAIIDNLTTADAAKPLSSKQGKALQDNKLGKFDNAATATKLATARNIGGVSFDGSKDINLPGVNTIGNQNTTGNAATATRFAIARKINGVSFDGSTDINLPDATTQQKGVIQLVNDLTTGGIDKALTAEQGKILLSMFANSKTPNGYQKLPGGLIIQWGSITTATSTVSQTMAFPIAFPQECLQVINQQNHSTANTALMASGWTAVDAMTTTYFTTPYTASRRWLAIGH